MKVRRRYEELLPSLEHLANYSLARLESQSLTGLQRGSCLQGLGARVVGGLGFSGLGFRGV